MLFVDDLSLIPRGRGRPGLVPLRSTHHQSVENRGWRVAVKVEYVCGLVLPDVRTDLGFQKCLHLLCFGEVRVGQLSLCSQVLFMPLGIPPPHARRRHA